MNTLKQEERYVTLQYWYNPNTYKTLINGLQSISGRVYTMHNSKPLTISHKLNKGWNELILFTPSMKQTKNYLNRLTKHNVKFKIM
jgi:hypothetical protein